MNTKPRLEQILSVVRDSAMQHHAVHGYADWDDSLIHALSKQLETLLDMRAFTMKTH